MILCAIEKCGTVTTRNLMRDLNRNGRSEDSGLAEAAGWSKKDLGVHAGDHDQAKLVWSRAQYDAALADSEWTKFLFYRDPLLRFISGWASKCTDGHDSDRGHCAQAFGAESTPLDRAILGLRRWSKVPWCINLHWRPQVYFCGGAERQAHYTTALLNRTSASVLANLISSKLHGADPENRLRRTISGSARGSKSSSGHATHAKADMLDAFANAAELKQIIRDFYKKDYELLEKLGVTPP